MAKEEIKKEMIKHFQLNENENIKYQNLLDAIRTEKKKTVLKSKKTNKQILLKVNKRNKIIKIRIEVDQIKTEKQQGKTVKPKFFMKIDKVDQPVVQVIKRKREDIITQIRNG